MRLYSIARLGLVLGFLFAFGLTAPEARAGNPTELKAREAFAAGRYEDALNLFAKLYAETLHPVYLRNIGRCHQKLKQPDQAIDKFNEYLAKEKKVSADERKEIEGYIKDMQALKDEQARQSAPPPPPPPVTPINPNPPPPTANPPPPTYTGPPTGTTSGTLIAQPGPREEETPVYKKWWFWTGIGAVVAGVVIVAIVRPFGGKTTMPPCTATDGCM
ncbi:MAG TPA: hypothetical protein VKQ32_19040 [Polyangia bacterium]|nr:hypothetical protein [Polyangia bacterium]